jgi:uncharacterized delta-60 repeat protein
MNKLIEATCKAVIAVVAALLVGCGGGQSTEQGRFDYPTVLDLTYGDAGYRIQSTGLSEKAYLGSFSVADFIIDTKGRTMIVGTRTSTTREAWMLRLLPDGTPDASCGQSGWSSFQTGGPASPQKIAQLSDGRYVMGGYLGVPSIWAVREDCSVDLSFGKNGMAAVSAKSPTEVQDGVNAMAVDGFGRIVTTVASTMSGKLHVARFTSEGQIDKSFGAGQGYISVSPSDGAAPRPAAMVIRPDGRILVAASMVYSSQVGHWAGFVQLQSDGGLDGTFGVGGFVSVKPVPNYVVVPKSILLLSDGSVIQAGLTQPGVLVGTVIGADAYWIKVAPNGALTTNFGANGLTIWTAGPEKRQASSNYGVDLLVDGTTFLTCQNWINNTQVSSQIQAASPQVIIQRRSAETNELIAAFASGGTGWLPRQQDLAVSCIGLKRDNDGRVIALLDYGPAERATGQTFALVRLNR